MSRFEKVYWLVTLPPPPFPLKAFLGAVSAKHSVQNLEPQGLRGKNLHNKGLMASSRALATAFAVAMIADFDARGKVGCHMLLGSSCGNPHPFEKNREDVGAASVWKRKHKWKHVWAELLLRFRRVHGEETIGEAPLDASQIRWYVAWCRCRSRNSGTGAAIAATPRANKDQCWSTKCGKQNCACAKSHHKIAAQRRRSPSPSYFKELVFVLPLPIVVGRKRMHEPALGA